MKTVTWRGAIASILTRSYHFLPILVKLFLFAFALEHHPFAV